jgi:hypothetical protein
MDMNSKTFEITVERRLAMSRRVLCVVCLAVMVAGLMVASPAEAVGLTGNEPLGDGVLSGTGGPINAQADNKTFWWADTSGDGVTGDAATAGLDLGGFNLTRTNDATGVVVDLDDVGDGSTGGAITNGGDTLTNATAWNQNASTLTITHAANITVNNISVNSQNLAAGDWSSTRPVASPRTRSATTP